MVLRQHRLMGKLAGSGWSSRPGGSRWRELGLRDLLLRRRPPNTPLQQTNAPFIVINILTSIQRVSQLNARSLGARKQGM